MYIYVYIFMYSLSAYWEWFARKRAHMCHLPISLRLYVCIKIQIYVLNCVRASALYKDIPLCEFDSMCLRWIMRVSLFNSMFSYTGVSSDDTMSVRGSLKLTEVVCKGVFQLEITLLAIWVGSFKILLKKIFMCLNKNMSCNESRFWETLLNAVLIYTLQIFHETTSASWKFSIACSLCRSVLTFIVTY